MTTFLTLKSKNSLMTLSYSLKTNIVETFYLEQILWSAIPSTPLWFPPACSKICNNSCHKISYVVNKVFQFMSNPLEFHWIVFKIVLRYLKGSINFGLKFYYTLIYKPLSLKLFLWWWLSNKSWWHQPLEVLSSLDQISYLGGHERSVLILSQTLRLNAWA